MKRIKFTWALVGAMLLGFLSHAQEEKVESKYITVTTMHWNFDKEDFKLDEWKKTEKEYLEKVTSKNEFILSSSYYMHRYTADNSEVIYVQSYASWEDIDKASARNGELEKAAWPEKSSGDAFFNNRDSYYTLDHSDEIYATLPDMKRYDGEDKDLILYLRVSHFAAPEDGSKEEFEGLRKMEVDKIISKNEYIKGYYPSVHAWGSSKTEFVEAFLLDNIGDLDKMSERSGELAKEAWPDEEEMKKLGKDYGKYFSNRHSDYIYTYVAGLSK